MYVVSTLQTPLLDKNGNQDSWISRTYGECQKTRDRKDSLTLPRIAKAQDSVPHPTVGGSKAVCFDHTKKSDDSTTSMS